MRGIDTKGEIVRLGSHLRTSRMLTSTLHSFVVSRYHLKLCGCFGIIYRCETVRGKYGVSVFLRGTLLSINVLAAMYI